MRKTVIILFLAYACMVVWSDSEGPKCKFWKQLASNLSQLNQLPYGTKMYMQCDGGCSNITCSGNLEQSGIFTSTSISIDFCFGVQLNHCQDPVAMQYYLDIIYAGNAKQNIHKVGNITHNDTYEVPVPVPSDLPIPGDVKLILFVELVPMNDGNFVNFKLTGKVRVMELNTPMFPYQTTIIPETRIDVPKCPKDQSLLKDFIPPQTCKAPPPPNKTHSTTKPPNINSDTYKTSCEFGLGQCVNKNEMCQATGDTHLSKHGICVCVPDASMDAITGYCEKSHISSVTKAIITTVLPAMNISHVPGVTEALSSPGKNKHLIPIIVGSVGGVVILIAVGILVIIFIGRRKRIARYRDRQQLLSDDMMDEEDDTNVTM